MPRGPNVSESVTPSVDAETGNLSNVTHNHYEELNAI